MTIRTTSPLAPADSQASLLHDVVCPFCPLTCDDLVVEISDQGVKVREPACSVAREKFAAASAVETARAGCLVDGRLASLAQAITAAAQLLHSARRPLLTPLSHTSCEAQRAALALADEARAMVGTEETIAAVVGDVDSPLAALQTVGMSTCTLGELRTRADLVVLWGWKSTITRPRFLERAGLAVNARAGKRLITVDMGGADATLRPDESLEIKPASELASIWTLRAAVRDVQVNPETVLTQTGLPWSCWQQLARQLRECHYGVLVVDQSCGEDSTTIKAGPTHRIESLAALVRELCAFTRFSLQVMPTTVGAGAAAQVLAWTTGYGENVDLGRGYPRSSPGDCNGAAAIDRGAVDVVVRINSDVSVQGSSAVGTPKSLPIQIVLDSAPDGDHPDARVLVRTAQPGVHCGGTAYRYDDVPLELRSLTTTNRPTTEFVLGAIRDQIRKIVIH